MAQQGPSTLASLFLIVVLGASADRWFETPVQVVGKSSWEGQHTEGGAAAEEVLKPSHKVCFTHVTGIQLRRQGRQSMPDKCVNNDMSGHEIACTTDCSGYEQGMEVFAVHDPSCRNIDHVSLTLIRTYHNSEGSVISYNAGNVARAEFKPFTSPWLQRVNVCPYREMFFAELNLAVDSLADCSTGRVTYHFNVSLYNEFMKPVICVDNHMQFWSVFPNN